MALASCRPLNTRLSLVFVKSLAVSILLYGTIQCDVSNRLWRLKSAANLNSDNLHDVFLTMGSLDSLKDLGFQCKPI